MEAQDLHVESCVLGFMESELKTTLSTQHSQASLWGFANNARPLNFFELIAAVREEMLWLLVSTVRRDRNLLRTNTELF
jgi:hypothetical protein